MGIIWSRCTKTVQTSLVKLLPEDVQDRFPNGISIGIIIDQILYQPELNPEDRSSVQSPDFLFCPNEYEEIWIHTSDRVRLHAFLLKQGNSLARPTFLYFHGNAGNIGHRLELAQEIYKKLQCNVLLVDYRGYGLSGGKPSESGLYKDAKASFLYIERRPDLDSKKIIVFGRSLGGAIAIHLSTLWNFRELVYALIVENTFTSIPDVAKYLFPTPVVTYLPTMFYNSTFTSKKKISRVLCPTLFISGSADEIIPRQMMFELYSNCTAGAKDLAEIPGGTHNETCNARAYIPHIRRFLDQVAKIHR